MVGRIIPKLQCFDKLIILKTDKKYNKSTKVAALPIFIYSNDERDQIFIQNAKVFFF